MKYFALILLLALPAWAAPEDVIKQAQQAERDNQMQKAAEALGCSRANVHWHLGRAREQTQVKKPRAKK